MPTQLKRAEGCLALTLKGLGGPEFGEALNKVKTIPGRRWNPEGKVWELPDDPNTLMQAVEILRPELSAELKKDIQAAQGAVADDLVTRAGTDADLLVPWASQLWPFQRAGVEFAMKHTSHINADDLGLGKTIMAITSAEEFYMRRYAGDNASGDGSVHFAPGVDTYRDKPVLVICPNTIRQNWKREIEEGPNPEYFDTSLWPPLSATIIDAKKPADRLPQIHAAVARNDYIIVNWEKLKLLPELEKIEWSAVIADEAHRAKNRKSKQGVALRRLKAPLKIAATGTPIMNSPDELWPLLNWIDRKNYGSYWRFFNMYVESYEGYKGSKVITGVRNADALRFELRDKLIRRTKKQVLDDFPDKLPVEVIEVEMFPKQKKAYANAQNDFMLDIEAAMKDSEDKPEKQKSIIAALRAGDLGRIGREIPNAAARMSFMRQVATSPALIADEDGNYGPDISSKLDAAQEKIEDHPGKQFVVACWHRRAAEVMVDRLKVKNRNAAFMHGSVDDYARSEMVQAFQDGELEVLVCTIATGGVGITLTAADTILFIEDSWVPAENRQMQDRLWRIGQKRDVSVLCYRSKDTVDTLDIAPANRLKELIERAVYGEKV